MFKVTSQLKNETGAKVVSGIDATGPHHHVIIGIVKI